MRKALLVLLAASLGTACHNDDAGTAKAGAGLPDGDPALACRMAQRGVVLDVRTPEEFRSGHVEGAVNIPVGELDGQLGEVRALTEGDESTPIVVYCASGRRSARAKNTLIGAGYDQVTNLGGFDDWPDDCARP